MSVRFILGRSGTGKTSYCKKAIVQALLDKEDSHQLILLVPEQATYQGERAILSDNRIKGYHRLNILSFDRLQFMLLGKNAAKATLSRIGRQMIVQRLLQENKDRLQVFGSAAGRIGTSAAIAQTIVELHRYGRGTQDIDGFIDTLEKYDSDSVTALKFKDIALIYKEYLKTVRGKFIDPDMQLNLARDAVAVSPLIKGARLWVDGFAGFTASETSLLAELLQNISQSHIALCLDASRIDLKNPHYDPSGLFSPTEKTYCDLIEVIRKCKIKLDVPVILEEVKRFENRSPLEHIEKEIINFKPKKISAADNIKITAAADARSEVLFAAREICKLVKENKYRYRDIAIVASDIDSYEHYLRAYLADYQIPYFIDKRQALTQHPVIGLICSALAIANEGFAPDEVFSYLKTGLVGIDEYDIDLLENYCLAFGITDKDWHDGADWNFAGTQGQFDDKRIDKIRRKIAEPLIELTQKLRSAAIISADDFTKVLFGFLDMLGVRERINDWVDNAIAEGNSQLANKHQQFCERLCDTLDEMVEVFENVELTCDRFLEILKNAFSQMTLAFIPPKLDQVLVGSIERSRHPDLKAVFLLGCTQKQFPSPVAFDSILTETDRAIAQQSDFELAPSARQQLCQRDYLAYIAFTRASERLYVSFSRADSRGSALARSQYVTKLSELFHDLQIENYKDAYLEIEKVNNEYELTGLLCERLGAKSEIEKEQQQHLQQLLSVMADDEQLNKTAQFVNQSLHYANDAHLDKKLAGEIFESTITASATRLSTFAACPYQFFAKYILGLKERRQLKFEPLDRGSFYHTALDAFVKGLLERSLEITNVPNNELIEILNEQISRMINQDSFLSNFSSHSRHNAYILDAAREALEDFVVALARIIRAGDFRPLLTEAAFGNEESRLGLCRIELPNGRQLILNGKIDRIDTAKIQGDDVVIIFDYKLHERSFDWSKFFYGLDMQIPLYLLSIAKTQNNKYKAIGGFYLPVESSPERIEFDRIDNKSDSFNNKARGIFNGQYASYIDKLTSSGWSKFYNFCFSKNDEQFGRYDISGVLKDSDFKKVIDFTEHKIKALAVEMASGQIGAAPYWLNYQVPCRWCKYRSVCRFDWQINDYRILQTKNKPAVLNETGGGDG